MKNTSLQFDPVNFGLRKWTPIAQEIDIPSDIIQWNSQKLVIQMVSSDAKFDSYQNQTEHFGELRFNRSHRLHESAEDTLFWRSKSLRRIDIDKTIQQYRTHPQTSVHSTKESDFIDRLCTEERNCLLKCTLLFNILSRQFSFFLTGALSYFGYQSLCVSGSRPAVNVLSAQVTPFQTNPLKVSILILAEDCNIDII